MRLSLVTASSGRQQPAEAGGTPPVVPGLRAGPLAPADFADAGAGDRAPAAGGGEEMVALGAAWQLRIRSCRTLPSLPGVALKILGLCREPETSTRDIAECVGQDPALTAKVLRVVNSPVYGFRSEITTLSHGTALLGLNAVRSIALSFSLVRGLQGSGKSGFDHLELPRGRDGVQNQGLLGLHQHSLDHLRRVELHLEEAGRIGGALRHPLDDLCQRRRVEPQPSLRAVSRPSHPGRRIVRQPEIGDQTRQRDAGDHRPPDLRHLGVGWAVTGGSGDDVQVRQPPLLQEPGAERRVVA
ncbi:MAG: HDOD domain-containing protein, partial [Candidatus Eisenbacteria bacterium]|nr:HDOD domain-containing protein [Candidatus Eisenbacteria bacterium]